MWRGGSILSPNARQNAIQSIVLFSALGLTFLAWKLASDQLHHRSLEHFERSVLQTTDVLAERMQKYDEALRAGVALLRVAGGEISADEWQVFVRNLRIDERYPGINGMGLIFRVPDERLPSFFETHQSERPFFDMQISGTGPEHYIVTYIEPLAENLESLGLDISFEDNRHRALLSAAESGETRITAPIILVQDETATAGFLLLAPIYVDDSDGQSGFAGAAFAPFVVERLMEGVLGQSRRYNLMRIADGNEVIYDELNPDEADFDDTPIHQKTVDIPMFGRTWHITYQSNLAFRHAQGGSQPGLILLGGVMVNVALFFSFLSLTRTKERAHRYARYLTQELETEKQELEASNAALERYARISSHDLRTPLRALRDLTEYLTEDLCETHPEATETPKFKGNINQIKDMITRMENLVAGMLKYSQLGQTTLQKDVFDAEEVILKNIEALDLGVERFSFLGEFPQLCCDRLLFDLIVGNLCQNAVQHHPDHTQVEVLVSGKVFCGNFRLSIKDNGVGINPRYHDRIFDMFQTLGHNTLPHQTGLGLAYVKRAVTVMGGHVTVTSQPNDGSVFQVTLHNVVSTTVEKKGMAA